MSLTALLDSSKSIDLEEILKPKINVEDHLGLAFDFVLRNCSIKGPVKDSEEYSDAVLGLMQAVETYKYKTKFSTYATVCIRNAVLNGLRDRNRFPECGKQIEIKEDDTTQNFENREAMEWVLAVEPEAPHDQLDRQMMLEHYLGRLSMKLVGQKYGVTRGRVNQRIARAISRLRKKATKNARFRLQFD